MTASAAIRLAAVPKGQQLPDYVEKLARNIFESGWPGRRVFVALLGRSSNYSFSCSSTFGLFQHYRPLSDLAVHRPRRLRWVKADLIVKSLHSCLVLLVIIFVCIMTSNKFIDIHMVFWNNSEELYRIDVFLDTVNCA